MTSLEKIYIRFDDFHIYPREQWSICHAIGRPSKTIPNHWLVKIGNLDKIYIPSYDVKKNLSDEFPTIQ